MSYVIIGTAGHIDHGKTVLVEALTGVKTDRLKEEQERGISIELGFAAFKLPDGTRVGVVDVPGHERFIRQMLAGVAGIDIVLFVVAADESIMPQTREHLAILDLLQVKNGIVVITKADLVDEDWLELVKEDIKETLAGTVLEDAPIVPVSAVTGQGMDRLHKVLVEKIEETPPKVATGKMRLPIDRFFTVTGFGTVVTGTLWSGQLRVGDQVEIMPERINSRVRNIQVHGEDVAEAVAGQRVAINLANVEVEQLHRGQMLAEPGLLTPSYRMDVQLKLIKSVTKPLKQRARIRLHLGTAEVFARVNLLDREELVPGETCLCQLLLEEPIVAARQDKFVIRTYSPMFTIGGGVVIEPVAQKHKRYRQEILEQLATKLKGSPAELILQHLSQQGKLEEISGIAESLSLSREEVQEAVDNLAQEQSVENFVYDGLTFVIAGDTKEKLADELVELLSRYHEKFPLRAGMPKEELRSKMFSSWSARQFNAFVSMLESDGHVKIYANEIATKEFKVSLTDRQEQIVKSIVAMLEEKPFLPPGWKEIMAELSLTETEATEILGYMMRNGLVEKVSDELVFAKSAVERAKKMLAKYIKEQKTVTLGEARDLLGSSRKYVLPLLEYFDQIKFTKRIQDKRILF
ncbi:MAG: selenocysteine-specific translation elongation factor [Thermoanaerobacteraceae bacterium]|nr:selenocysteine-specific translation elongation factor [Thermoanaerobacteraceae bacterium]